MTLLNRNSTGFHKQKARRISRSTENSFFHQKGRERRLTAETVVDETPFINPAGASGYYEYIFNSVISANGETVEAVAGSARAITDRRLAEEALRESELQMRLVVEAADMGTWDWNLKTGAVR